jgi:hypothetical protein
LTCGKLAHQKVANASADLGGMRFKRKVPRVQQVNLRFRHIAAVREGSSGHERRIVLAPDGQKWRLLRPEVLLELRISGDIGSIVEDQVQLNLLGTPGRPMYAMSSV